MKTHAEIAVTLSPELLACLREQAEELKVPLKWLVAGLVCDTIDTDESPRASSRPSTRHVA